MDLTVDHSLEIPLCAFDMCALFPWAPKPLNLKSNFERKKLQGATLEKQKVWLQSTIVLVYLKKKKKTVPVLHAFE